MTCASEQPSKSTIRYRRLRAPANHGQALILPALEDCHHLVESNLQRAQRRQEIAIGDTTVGALAAEARQHLVSEAVRYTQQYRNVNGALAPERLLLAGHQPQLFHPGVWFKNFALHQMAVAVGATAINLVIDNDVCGTPFIQVPTGSTEHPRLISIDYDRAAAAVPYEQRGIIDPDRFDSFGQRVTSAIQPLIKSPLVEQLWPYAVEARRRSASLGSCLAEARHRLEGDYGLRTLELPLSRVCESSAFHQFVRGLLIDLPRFRRCYNDAVLEYRREHRLRSNAHPVPLLGGQDEWLESPFWAWTNSDPVRRPLFVKAGRAMSGQRLRMGSTFFEFANWEQGTVKIRPRALMTTMFARLCLSDLFLHGIGGSKYDQVTDAIMERYFGADAPGYFTLTATMQLPLHHVHVEADDVRRINGLLRDLWYHPEQMEADCPHECPHECPHDGADSADFPALAKEKKRMLSCLPPRGQRKQWHDELQRLNTQIRTLVSSCRNDLLEERERLITQLRKDTLMSSREYAFCLFPATTLIRTLLDLCCVSS